MPSGRRLPSQVVPDTRRYLERWIKAATPVSDDSGIMESQRGWHSVLPHRGQRAVLCAVRPSGCRAWSGHSRARPGCCAVNRVLCSAVPRAVPRAYTACDVPGWPAVHGGPVACRPVLMMSKACLIFSYFELDTSTFWVWAAVAVVSESAAAAASIFTLVRPVVWQQSQSVGLRSRGSGRWRG